MLGPSGCGKSTLLKIVAGLIPATDGTLEVFGEPIIQPRQDIGIVFQNALLSNWRTVFENVMVPVEVLKLPKDKYRQKAIQLLKLAGLERFANNYPSELSGGMQQRVAICRAHIRRGCPYSGADGARWPGRRSHSRGARSRVRAHLSSGVAASC